MPTPSLINADHGRYFREIAPCRSCKQPVGVETHPQQMTEKQWLSQVTELAHLLGWHTYHTWNSMHSAKGFPDLVLVKERPGLWNRLIFAELKSEKGKVSEAQSEWIARLWGANVECYVWRPSQFNEVMKILRRK